MLLHFILLLPAIHTSKIVINQYSMKQVKLDDDMINQVLLTIFPKKQVALREFINSLTNISEYGSMEDELNFAGVVVPTYEQVGQKRFKKIKRVDPVKYSVRAEDNMDTQVRSYTSYEENDNTDPILLLSKLVVKLMQFLPPKFSEEDR
ncbi:unnamed protein product [Chrysodeixis includens]|uniref:Uncharacterized protein n=1 Tax=Chrysodeixis includens TaxID=689277 RepID=A0A9N8KY43_CHRIL|nr:unnamed protein product [Chrysodeixis includens]